MIEVNIKGSWVSIIENSGVAKKVLYHFNKDKYCAYVASDKSIICFSETGVNLQLDFNAVDDASEVLNYIQSLTLRNRTYKSILLILIIIFGCNLIGGFYALNTRFNQTSSSSVVLPSISSLKPMSTQPVRTLPAPAPQNIYGNTINDGWQLAEDIRESLPGKLQKAAQSGIFTVSYSTGHKRTIYVFADPLCPNCQRLEPTLNQIAKSMNVIIFPVSVIGGDKSAEHITSLLCLPPDKRKAAWDSLFDIAAESAVLPKCDVGQNALTVNEVAYRTYRIPGTPWVISDRGRYISQQILKNPAALTQFMGD